MEGFSQSNLDMPPYIGKEIVIGNTGGRHGKYNPAKNQSVHVDTTQRQDSYH